MFEALKKVDNNILKLDTVDPEYIKIVDRPNAHYDVKDVIEKLKQFKGELIVQTMFLTGTVGSADVDNTTDKYVDPWIEALEQIKPKEVMIYTIARETPLDTLKKASKEQLDRIGDKLVSKGFKVQISY